MTDPAGNNWAESIDSTLGAAISNYEAHTDLRRLSGGASQETYRLLATINAKPVPLCIKRPPQGRSRIGSDGSNPASVVPTATEAALISAANAAGVPTPTVLYQFQTKDGLGEGFVTNWLEGETVGAKIVRSPSLVAARAGLAKQCGEALARIHSLEAVGTIAKLAIRPAESLIEERLASYDLLDSAQPMIDYTGRWLLEHLPAPAEPRVVHGDFRNGNLMVSNDGLIGVLDWELAHLGDPMRDLGWLCTPSWRFGRHDLPVGGFGSYEDLFSAYERVSGGPVDRKRLRFWEIFGSFWWSITCLEMAAASRWGVLKGVEYPGIGRRSSEGQMDCVNYLLPGPAVSTPAASLTSGSLGGALPTATELLLSVSGFLAEGFESAEGRSRFLGRVAANSLEIAARDLARRPALDRDEAVKLSNLLGARVGAQGDEVAEGRKALAQAIRSKTLDIDRPELGEYLRWSVTNELAIDQPSYPALNQSYQDAQNDVR